MLKSKSSKDHYGNVNLSNLKILSTSRSAVIQSDALYNVDAAIREIESAQCDLDNFIPIETIPGRPSDNESTVADTKNETPVEVLPSEPKVPVLLSIQYTDINDATVAIESFLTDYHEKLNKLEEQNAFSSCSHCESTEIAHSDKIALINTWRKSTMLNLGLKTTAFC
jgi:hypothetical protein